MPANVIKESIMSNAERSQPVIQEERALDGAQEVLLAPVRGADLRKSLPKDLFDRNPLIFTRKLIVAAVPIAASYAAIVLALREPLTASWPVIVLAVAVLGLIYAHLVELQHECLHEHAYRSRRLNRTFGFLCGVAMLSSFSHYKYEHLRHHAFLGTPKNREFFNYRFRNLNSWPGFTRAAFHLGRYVDVAGYIARSLSGRPIPRVDRERDLRRIRTEYRLFTAILILAAVLSAVTGSYFLIFAWVLPVVLVSEAAHYLIELPEHFGLNTQTDSNVLTNTRSIDASRLAQWFTNYNNMHTAHHYHQGVPMVNVGRLHELAKDRFEVTESSYLSFYYRVIRGELQYRNMDETPMTR
jgi:fatty acid desaturase